MTKHSYKKGFAAKRRTRSFLMPLFIDRYTKIVGLAGPSIKQYYQWCLQQGFKEITSYEYESRILNIQRVTKSVNKLNIKLKGGSILNASANTDTFYDIDLCDTIAKKEKGVEINKALIDKFKDTPFLLTLCTRVVGVERTCKEFLEVMGVPNVNPTLFNGKQYGLGNNMIRIYNTEVGKFVAITYKDNTSPGMICIARVTA